MDEKKDEFMTASEVAQLLRVDVSSVTRWAREGFLRSFRIGRQLRFKAADVNDFIHSNNVSKMEVKKDGKRR